MNGGELIDKTRQRAGLEKMTLSEDRLIMLEYLIGGAAERVLC